MSVLVLLFRLRITLAIIQKALHIVQRGPKRYYDT